MNATGLVAPPKILCGWWLKGRTDMEPSSPPDMSKRLSRWWLAVALPLAALLLYGLIGGIVMWPGMDEAYNLLGARNLADGMLPYRDYYEYLTPGVHVLGALVFKLNGGVTVIGMRLLVLACWVLEIAMISDMARARLSKLWVGLLVLFLWSADTAYPVYQHHFWSGLFAVGGVYFAWRALNAFYSARLSDFRKNLALSGVITALSFWFTQSLGVFIALAIGVFGILHALLHEREERHVPFGQLGFRSVLARWWPSWGRCWLLPMLGIHAVSVLLMMALGIWHDFLRDSVFWLLADNYQKSTVMGYFTTFSDELNLILKPFADGVDLLKILPMSFTIPGLNLQLTLPVPLLALFIFRIPQAFWMTLIAVLPVVGILGLGYRLPARFMHRLLQRESEEELLWWLAGTAMIVSTFSYSTAMHVVSNGGIAYLAAVLVLAGWLYNRRRLASGVLAAGFVIIGLSLLGADVGTWIRLEAGTWMPRFPALGESLLYTQETPRPVAVVTTVKILEHAAQRGRSVFLFNTATPIWLAGRYQNATRYSLAIAKVITPLQEAEIVRDLEKNRPLFIVDDQTSTGLKNDRRYQRYRPEELRLYLLEGELKRHYSLMLRADRYLIYQRTDG